MVSWCVLLQNRKVFNLIFGFVRAFLHIPPYAIRPFLVYYSVVIFEKIADNETDTIPFYFSTS